MAISISVRIQPARREVTMVAFRFNLLDERIPRFILSLFDAAKFVCVVQAVLRLIEFVS